MKLVEYIIRSIRLAAFSERAHRNRLAVFDQTFSETIQNMSLCGQIPAPEDVLQAEKEEQEEEEEEDENRQLMCRLEEFYDNTTTDDIRGDAMEGCITAQYVNNRVIIRGPYGDPFEGGFEILRTGHLLYMDSVANLNTVEGFSGGAKLQIDLNLWKFLHYAARLCTDRKARDQFGPPEYPAGDDDDNGNGQDKGNGRGKGDMKRKTEEFTILSRSKTSTPAAPQVKAQVSSRLSAIQRSTPAPLRMCGRCQLGTPAPSTVSYTIL